MTVLTSQLDALLDLGRGRLDNFRVCRVRRRARRGAGVRPVRGGTDPRKAPVCTPWNRRRKRPLGMSGLFSVVVDCISRGTDARHQPCKVMIS